MLKHPYTEFFSFLCHNFYITFYAIHILVRGEGEEGRNDFEKKMTKFDIVGGWGGVQKILFCRRYTF